MLAQGRTVGATSGVTSFGTRWIEQLPERDNASGSEAPANGRRRNGLKPSPLTAEVLEVVQPAETLRPLGDEPIINTLVPTLDALVDTIGARCRDAHRASDRDQLAHRLRLVGPKSCPGLISRPPYHSKSANDAKQRRSLAMGARWRWDRREEEKSDSI